MLEAILYPATAARGLFLWIAEVLDSRRRGGAGMSARTGLLCAWLVPLLIPSSAAAVGIATANENFALDVEPAIQMRIQVDAGGPQPKADSAPGSVGTAAPDGDANIDLFVRRARVIIRATAYKEFSVGVNIVALRIGERGSLNSTPFVQDAVLRYAPADTLAVEAGLLLMPLSHAAVESAVETSAVEGAGFLIQLYNNASQLREAGLQLRALMFGRRLLVRGGFYEGARNTNKQGEAPLNPHGIPLVGGMVRWNLAGDETAYAPPSIYLDGKTRVSIGVGGQYQPHSGAPRADKSGYDDYLALATDLFADVALGANMEALLTFGAYRFEYGAGNAKTGNAIHATAGYRWGLVEPQASFQWFNSAAASMSSRKIAAGLNLFLHGHHAKLQAEFASIIMAANLATAPALHQVILQAQLAF